MQASKFLTITASSRQIFSKQAVATWLLLASESRSISRVAMPQTSGACDRRMASLKQNGHDGKIIQQKEPLASLLCVSHRWFGLFLNQTVLKGFLEGCYFMDTVLCLAL